MKPLCTSTGTRAALGLVTILGGVGFGLATAKAANDVAGALITFNDNGAWSWFQDERVIFDADKRKIVLSSVADASGPGGADRNGDVDVVCYDLGTRKLVRFTLSPQLEDDDHNSAGLLKLSDGRYLASYSKHSSDNRLRYRVSTNPSDVSSWGPEQKFLTDGGTTYSNVYHLSAPDAVFNFHRDAGRGLDPNYLIWRVDHAPGFSYGGRLLTGPEGNQGNRDRPYLRYVSNGVNRIDFIATDAHPRDRLANNVYHGYIKHEGKGAYGLYRSDGRRVGDLSKKGTSVASASDFTTLLAANKVSPENGLRMTRGWTTDIELDENGNPYAAFTARVDDNDRDHRFFYARFARGTWNNHELAKAGGGLYAAERDYTGLVALDPEDPNRLYISTKIDPRDDSDLQHHEIFVGVTDDGGANWQWAPITYNSSEDNIRPIVPKGAGDETIVLWMRGVYNDYRNFNIRIVGLTEITSIDAPADYRPERGDGAGLADRHKTSLPQTEPISDPAASGVESQRSKLIY